MSAVCLVIVVECRSLSTRDVLGEERMVGAIRTVERKRTAIARGGGELRLDERLPVSGVYQDMRELAASVGEKLYASGDRRRNGRSATFSGLRKLRSQSDLRSRPTVRIELTTSALRKLCSTVELRRRFTSAFRLLSGIRTGEFIGLCPASQYLLAGGC